MTRPSARDHEMSTAYLEHGRSATKAALALGCKKHEVIQAMMRVHDYLRLSGWADHFADAIKAGFGWADARDMADQKAAYQINKLEDR